MNFLSFLLVLLLLVVDAALFFIVGAVCSGVETVKKLKEKGWTIEPPKMEEVIK